MTNQSGILPGPRWMSLPVYDGCDFVVSVLEDILVYHSIEYVSAGNKRGSKRRQWLSRLTFFENSEALTLCEYRRFCHLQCILMAFQARVFLGRFYVRRQRAVFLYVGKNVCPLVSVCILLCNGLSYFLVSETSEDSVVTITIMSCQLWPNSGWRWGD